MLRSIKTVARHLTALLALVLPLCAVDFTTQVHPILARCTPCHGGDKPAAGLSFASRDAALKGAADGLVIVPGNSRESLLILRVSGEKGAMMPPVGAPLSPEQVATLRAWIDEGAIWPATASAPAATGAANWIAPIAPRNPPIPGSDDSQNPIDRFMADYLAKHNLPAPQIVSDAVFARRIYFDVWGVPPTPEQLDAFLQDRNPRKRELLAQLLLDDSRLYAGNWISWWNDLLRNDTGVNYQGDRKSITTWLLKALKDDMPYDRMISALVNPVRKDDPEGFLIGVNWRGTVNASQTPYMQAAQNTGQVFLGVNLKCASCHDSFINRYKLRQSYGMAALFSPESKLELVRCDVNQGKFVTPQVLYPELTTVSETATLPERHAAAASFFTDPRNGRVPRTIVNRYWQKLFGRGLVEPVDDMDAEPWNADLLDWLASDFTAHGNDLQYLLKLILTSKTYQMPAIVSAERPDKAFVFRGPYVRRLSAEQFIDTVSAVTGEWPALRNGKFASLVRDWELKSSPLSVAMGRPIRDQVFTTRDNRSTTFQALELVNGDTLSNMLRRGSLRLLGELPPAPPNLFDSGILKKGSVAFDVDISQVKQLWLLTQDAGSYDPSRTVAGWTDVVLSGPAGSKNLEDLATLSKLQPASFTVAEKAMSGITVPLDSRLIYPIDSLGFTRIRGRVVIDDHSQPNDIAGAVRFFVFGMQPDMERLVKVEGDPPEPFPVPVRSESEAVTRLYVSLLGRPPVSAEQQAAAAFFKTGLQAAPLEDFLWSLLLHPDFQYIY